MWINVNTVTDIMIWQYSGGLIWSIPAAYDNLTWLSVPFDHWYVTSHPAPVLSRDSQDRWAQLTSHASFYNTDFCGGTGTTYQPNSLIVFGTGSDRGTISTWDWGCDSNLLSFGTSLG